MHAPYNYNIYQRGRPLQAEKLEEIFNENQPGYVPPTYTAPPVDLVLDRGLSEYFSKDLENKVSEYFRHRENPGLLGLKASQISEIEPAIGRVLQQSSVIHAITTGNPTNIIQAIGEAAANLNINPDNVISFVSPYLAPAEKAKLSAYGMFANKVYNLSNRIPEGNLRNLVKGLGVAIGTYAGAKGIYHTAQSVYNDVNYIVNSISNIWPFRGNTPIGTEIIKLTDELTTLIGNETIKDKDDTSINNILKILGAKSLPALQKLSLQGDLEDNMLSLLKRRFKESINDIVSLNEFKTSSMRNRALQIAQPYPQLEGYPGKII